MNESPAPTDDLSVDSVDSVATSDARTVDARIGATVRKLRGERSQRDVAAAMKARGWPWGQATVWQIESGTRPLRLAEALDLAAELEASLDRLLTPADQVTIRGPLRDLLDALGDLNEAIDELAAAQAQLEKAERKKELAEQAFRRAQAVHDGTASS